MYLQRYVYYAEQMILIASNVFEEAYPHQISL